MARYSTLVRTLKYRLETLFSIGRCLNYDINFACAIDYADFFHTNPNLSIFDMRLENLLGENDGLFAQMETYRQAWCLHTYIQQQMTFNLVTVSAQDIPNIPNAAINTSVGDEIVTSVTGKRKSDGAKKESAAEKRRKHKEMSKNARRRAGGGNLTRGYMKMPKDRAVYQCWTGTYVPTIQIDDMQNLEAFHVEFPKNKREHGFMVSCNGQTFFLNKYKQDFQPEVITIKFKMHECFVCT